MTLNDGGLGMSGKATGCLRAAEPLHRLVVLETLLSEETENEAVDADHSLKEEYIHTCGRGQARGHNHSI